MLTALLLFKPAPPAHGRRGPFRAERFEYVVASRELVLLRLSGRWRARDSGPPARVTLEASTGSRRLTFAPLPDIGAASAGRRATGRRATGRRATGWRATGWRATGWRATGWRASFSIPLDVAEDATTTFTLRADRMEVELPRPVERVAEGAAEDSRHPAPARGRTAAAGDTRATEIEREMRVEARRALGEARAELEALRAETEQRRDECSALRSRLAAEEGKLALARAENERGALKVRAVRRRIADLGDSLEAARAERNAEHLRADALARRQDRLEAEARSRGIRIGESRRRIVELRDALAERALAGGAESPEHERDEKVAKLRDALDAARAESAVERQRAAVLAGQLIGVAEASPPAGRRPARRGFDLPRPLSAADRRARDVTKAERRLAEIKGAVERALERDPATP